MKIELAKPLSIHQLGQRKNQEDNIFPRHGRASVDDRLFVVCDGMGGHDSGEVASDTVCRVLGREIPRGGGSFTEEDFVRALNVMYDELDKLDTGALKKMGTTMTCIKFHDTGALLAHIGDSRIYHIRPSQRKIIYQSRDHSLVNDLYQVGALTLEETKTFPQRNVITRVVQPHQEVRSMAEIHNCVDIQPGDFFYMCTDGMLEQIEDEQICNILCDPKNSDNQKIKILERVTQNNKDNHSAYLIKVAEVDGVKEAKPPKSKSKSKIILIIISLLLLAGIYLTYKYILPTLN